MIRMLWYLMITILTMVWNILSKYYLINVGFAAWKTLYNLWLCVTHWHIDLPVCLLSLQLQMQSALKLYMKWNVHRLTTGTQNHIIPKWMKIIICMHLLKGKWDWHYKNIISNPYNLAHTVIDIFCWCETKGIKKHK